MDNKTNIFTIVVTYNDIKWIEKCFGSLINSTIQSHIIAIDNGSTDKTVNYIKDKYSQVEVIETGKNIGFGKANNIGIRKALDAKADYVFLLNQDAWVEKDTLSKLINLAEKNPDFGVISPVHINASNTGLDVNFSNYIIPKYCPSFYSDLYMGMKKELYKTKYVNAAAWLISRSCICKVGLFEPLFFMYGEDDNYVQRANYHGFNIGIAANSRIYHDRELRQGKRTNNGDLIYLRKTNLVCLLNINNGFIKNYLKFFEFNLINLFKSIILLRYRFFLKYLIELFYFTFCVVKIYKVRNAARNYGMNL